jgi:glycosyltransferase involved in cell wall biosynthesis
MKKFVSIILPVYNSKKYISKTINSIMSQSHESFELVIIDDCSTDGTYELIKKIKKNNKKIKLFQTSKNSKTPAIPRNIGLKKSKGEIICFIDSDDLWEKDKLKIQLKEFKSKKNIITTAAKYFSRHKTSSYTVNLLRRFLHFFFYKKN